MSYAPTADDPSLAIPARPSRAAAAPRARRDWRAEIHEASLVGFVTLAVSWALAELAFALFG